MFMYEKNGAICVTFKSNMPVDAPEYVITIDKESRSVYVNGKQFIDTEDVTEEQPKVEPEVIKKPTKATKTVKVEQPVVEDTKEEAPIVTEE